MNFSLFKLLFFSSMLIFYSVIFPLDFFTGNKHHNSRLQVPKKDKASFLSKASSSSCDTEITIDTILCPEATIPINPLRLKNSLGCDSIITYNIQQLGSGANPGISQNVCSPEIILDASLPFLGTGTGTGVGGVWTSASSAIILDASNPKTMVSELEEGDNWFIWSLSTAQCIEYGKDSVNIFFENNDVLAIDDIFDYRETPINKNVLNNDNNLSVNNQVIIKRNSRYGEVNLNLDGTFTYQKNRQTTDDILFDDFEYTIKNINCQEIESSAKVVIRFIGNNEPLIFTPNEDGINDTFVIRKLADNPNKYPENELLIFNRWGQVIFQAKPYKNDWNGGYNNDKSRPVPEGSYFYIIKLTIEDQGKSEVKIFR